MSDEGVWELSDLTPAEGFEPATTEALARQPAAEGSGLIPAAEVFAPALIAEPTDRPADLPDAHASLLALIDRLAVLLDRSDLLELEVEAGSTGLLLRKPAALVPFGQPAASADGGGSVPEAPADQGDDPANGQGGGASAAAPASTVRNVKAPLTGIFYASPSPGSPPYVKAGGEVAVGQVIGLIEAMKLFNEIKSDKSGRVVRVVAESGTLVKAKQPLIEVEPL
ncbi:MAG: acetyl-CoA carboxylase biotin carboxyl carrier protein [Candidatus Limnocylindrales bacterium]